LDKEAAAIQGIKLTDLVKHWDIYYFLSGGIMMHTID